MAFRPVCRELSYLYQLHYDSGNLMSHVTTATFFPLCGTCGQFFSMTVTGHQFVTVYNLLEQIKVARLSSLHMWYIVYIQTHVRTT